MRLAHWGFVALPVMVAAHVAAGQGSLASRVAAAPDGVVRFQFASRSGVCGDGRDVVGYRGTMYGEQFQSRGRWSDVACVAGPIRVSLSVQGGSVVRERVQVGGGWSSSAEHVTDIGSIGARDASEYLFSLVPRLEATSNRRRLLLAPVLADSTNAMPQLLRLARDEARLRETRTEALEWVGTIGDASVVPALVEFGRGARAGDDDTRGNGLSSSAVAALSFLDDWVGVPALIDLARTGPTSARRSAVFWLGQSGDPRALKTLHTVIADAREDIEVRKNAIFSLGQSQEASTADIVGLYRTLSDAALREQVIFAISQRHDDASLDALIAIARDDADRPMRSKALFWLGQRHDPRATKVISEMILK